MVWLRLVYLFGALMVCLVGGGVSFGRRVFAEPKLVMVGSVGIGGIILYLAAGVIYLTGASWQWGFLVTGWCVLGVVSEWKELRRWWRDAETRSILIGWMLIELWILLANLEIRHFAIWIGDWQEHYDRAIFFLQHWALARQVYGPYSITARPPMMNLIQAMFMGQAGHGYDFFQVAAGVLNGSLYLAVAAWAGDFGGKNAVKLVAALMALSPWFVQNATYPWTKLYCAFYVVLGIWFYRRSLREEKPPGRKLKILALLMLMAGILVHYSAAIPASFIVLHDLLRHRRQWRRIFASWVLCALLLGTWGAWVLFHFGLHGAAGATSTVYEAERNSRAALVQNIGLNAAYSLVPRVVLDWPATMNIVRSNQIFWNKVRDVMFLGYEPGLLLAWGLGGMIAMAWSLYSARRHGERWFWIGLVVWSYVFGLLVCTPPSYYLGGVAHVLLQPVVWMGLVFLVSRADRIPRWVRWIWWWGIFVDMAWLLLHLGLEGRVLQYAMMPNGLTPADPNAAATQTLANGVLQLTRGLNLLGMRTIQFEPLVITVMVCGALGWWMRLRLELNRSRRGEGEL